MLASDLLRNAPLGLVRRLLGMDLFSSTLTGDPSLVAVLLDSLSYRYEIAPLWMFLKFNCVPCNIALKMNTSPVRSRTDCETYCFIICLNKNSKYGHATKRREMIELTESLSQVTAGFPTSPVTPSNLV